MENVLSSSEKAGRVYRGIVRPAYTPNIISTLKEDEVFVFGSNLRGFHGGGAASVAMRKFGGWWCTGHIGVGAAMGA